MANLAIALTVVILFQQVLSLYQVQYYQRFMNDLVRRYQQSHNYRLVSEVVKSRLSSHIVALIYDENKVIVEAYYLNGVTIFSRFKIYQIVLGQHLDKSLVSIVETENQTYKTKAIQALVEKYT